MEKSLQKRRRRLVRLRLVRREPLRGVESEKANENLGLNLPSEKHLVRLAHRDSGQDAAAERWRDVDDR